MIDKKEPSKSSNLRDFDDEQLREYIDKYPKNVFVSGEIIRRKNLKLRQPRDIRIIGK